MDIEDIEKGKKRFKKSEIKENVNDRAKEIETLLKRGIKQGRYPELKEIGANLKDVAYILIYTESEKAFVEKVKQKRKEFKNYSTFSKRMEKNRMKMLFLKRSGKEKSFLSLPVKERMELVKRLRKYPEWYFNRAILDLGSYFEALSPSSVKQTEERRQYRLIARLLDDFGLFKQKFNKAWDEGEQDWDEAKREEHARERVVKRAEAIPAMVWKERIQGEKERLQKSLSSPTIKD